MMPLQRISNLLIGILLPILGLSQSSTIALQTMPRPTVSATQIEEGPVIDGQIRNETLWQNIPAITDFWQSQPKAGQPSSERTEVRIAYTATTLYISAVCYDTQPDKLVISDARRDASLDNTDAILFILDTYKDSQNGFVFGTSSLGAEYDAQVDNEGQGNFSANRQQGGMIGGFNLNWDASWQVETEVGDYGWSAEFAIPLRTIRFSSGDNQTWGLNFRRNIRKTNEIVYWSPMPIDFNLNRLSLAGTLTGLSLKNPGNLKVIPYVLGQAIKDYEVSQPDIALNTEVGADVKFSVTPALTLDLTYNTDFAQVEVDDQQVNLDRFNLFFPEKRPFFLENAGLFSVGSPGEVDLFFSRRIGIDESGAPVPIIGGARLSGKINQTYLGVLNMFTDEVGTDIDKNNFTVARVNHQFAQRSSVGAAFINRAGMGDEDEDFNRTYAVDGRIGIGQKGQISGFYSGTITPGVDSAQSAFKIQSRYSWNGLILNAAYTQVGENFNPEVGFLSRTAFRKPEFLVFQRVRMNGKWGLLEIRPHISYRGYWNFDNIHETSFLHVDNHWEWQSGLELHTGINFTLEGVVDDFEISQGVIVPEGTYRHKEAQLVFFTNRSKAVSINVRSYIGGAFGGNRSATRGTLAIRVGDKFNSEWSLEHNDFRLPNGDFIADIFRARLSYSFTPLIFAQALVQYNDVTKKWSANARFGWLQQANTGLFIVYNQTSGFGLIDNRSFTLKYTRVFDVLN